MLDQMVPVYCTDNGKETNGYILNVKRDNFLEVSLNTVRVKFIYNPKHKEYVGNMAGYEFVVKDADLPEDEIIKPFRRTR